jgi:hypothetical protein
MSVGPLGRCHDVFRRWFGDEYDMGSLDAVLSVAATHHLDGDPPWLLIVSGAGNAKTETVAALSGAGAHAVSTISSEGALLSASKQKERTAGATGGLLREIGSSGILVIKDFTSIISMNREVRGQVLGALREVYDGSWIRSVGTDGARKIPWSGRIVLVGAVTTVYDSAHAVIAEMGDRFALVRVDSRLGRLSAGTQALRNVGHEVQMRDELAAEVRELIGRQLEIERAELSEANRDLLIRILLPVANLVTYARTAVERDYQGNVINAHQPEAPTRLLKMLAQIVRGGLALGMTGNRALDIALRVAGDSMSPLRLAVLADVLGNPLSSTGDVRRRLQKPRNTIDRELQGLQVLDLLEQHEVPGQPGWRYVLSKLVDQDALKAIVSRKVSRRDVRD